MKRLTRTVLSASLVFSCSKDPVTPEKTLVSEDINLIEYELVYALHSALAPGLDHPDAEYDALVYCRTVGDTVISGVPVYRYRFIKVRPDTAETTMNFMHITDTSVVNHAYLGNVPSVFLKRRNVRSDSITLEETPYSTILFPYKDSAYWYTRPESTGLYSTKIYTAQEEVEVEAGRFQCARVYTELLPELRIPDLWAAQWWYGLVLVKSSIHYRENEITNEEGEVIRTVNSYETFELKEYRKLED